MSLDTHAAVRSLTATGFETEQAEAIVATVVRSDEERRAGFATKANIEAIRADIAALEARLVKWGVGLAAVLFAALRFTG